MTDRDLQHPDITTLEQTGAPGRFQPFRLEVDVTEEIARAYIEERIGDFIDWCLADPDIIPSYISDTERRFKSWVQEALS